MKTPFENASLFDQSIRDHWMRFNSLPHEIQEHLLGMLGTTRQGDIYAIHAKVMLKKMKAMTDAEIIDAWAFRKSKLETA